MAKVVERCLASPPPATVAATVLPLTYFDVLWMHLGPVQRLLFYECTGITTAGFLSSHLPHLRRSLSLTLQLFFSLCGRLSLESLAIEYADGDSVPLLVAEADDDFATLTCDAPKDVKLSHPLMPPLPPADERGRRPLLALQFTVFPGDGFSLGVTFHHVAADGNSIHRFLKSWAAFHRFGGNPSAAAPEAPVYARGSLLELEEEKKVFVEELKELNQSFKPAGFEKTSAVADHGRTVRATFVLDRFQIERIRDRIMSITGSRQSTFVAACSHLWVCMTKARGHEDRTVYFGFVADCRTRVQPPVPDAYFGNVIVTAICEASGGELCGPGGLVTASKAIHARIRSLEGRVVVGQREAARQFFLLVGQRIFTVAGSPRLRAYETDFGWGPPKKAELLSIEDGGACMGDSRRGEGGLEIGMAGPISEMERFGCFFKADLESY